jgi:hypothetical protein
MAPGSRCGTDSARTGGEVAPGPRLPTRCAGWCSSGLCRAIELGLMPSCRLVLYPLIPGVSRPVL